MTGYQVASYRPYVPVYASRALGQPTAQVEKFPTSSIMLGVINTAILGGAAWVGIRAGMKEHGFYSGLGWTIGILAGMAGVMALGMTTGLVVNSVFPKSNG